jgi:hypothetical protein
MADRRETRDERVRPLRSVRHDPFLWAKITALWHRERIRDQYVAAGYTERQARHKANQEAVEIARSHGWKGDVRELKSQLGELIAQEIPGAGKRNGGPLYWEEALREELLRVLGREPERMRDELKDLLRRDVASRGRFSGQLGLYRLGYVVSFVPTMDHLAHRNAFVATLIEVGHDPELCDRDLFRVVMRFLHQFTHKPFETRLGQSMPAPARTRKAAPRPKRRRLRDLLRSE